MLWRETASFMSKHTSSKILAENKKSQGSHLGFLYVNPTEALTQEETHWLPFSIFNSPWPSWNTYSIVFYTMNAYIHIAFDFAIVAYHWHKKRLNKREHRK